VEGTPEVVQEAAGPHLGRRHAARSAPATTATLGIAATAAAIVVIVGFGILVAVMIAHADVSDTSWNRLAWLFGAVEAVAFTAAGALFGSTVQRRRAERAEEEADANREGAVRGRALAAAITADGAAASVAAPEARGSRYEPMGPAAGAGGDAARAVADRHAALARELFGDL